MKKFFLILSVFIMVVSVVSCKKEKSSDNESDIEYTKITMEDLKSINGDDLEIEYKSDGLIKYIGGEFAYFPVTDKDKAYEAFMGISELIGIENAEDFVYDENASYENPNVLNHYYFSQYYEGIKIHGAFVRISVNPQQTDCIHLDSTYEPNLDIDTNPKISEKEAIKRAEEKYGAEVKENPELVIRKKKLAWDMDLLGSETERIIMRADNGEIIYEDKEIID